jgi:cyclic beta-1,2-glucan synthetase
VSFLFRPLRSKPAPVEKPLRDELLSVERLEERAKSLAARFTVASPERRLKRLRPRLRDNARLLRSAYEALADDVHRGQFITPPAEWLLDHFHVVQAEIRAIRQNLPNRYYRELPTLFERQYAGHARVYAMALELLRHSDSRLEQAQLVRFMNSYQSVAPLTIGELWAWPSILKVALIENLRRLAEELLIARDSRIAADAVIAESETHSPPSALPPSSDLAFVVRLLQRVREYGLHLSPLHDTIEEHLRARDLTSEDAIRGEHQRQAASQVSIANALTSLRLCSTLNWSDYFESVSLVEQALQRDPSGTYGAMDFLSRDRLRQVVEELAAPTGEAQMRVALRAIESARQCAEASSMNDRSAHVGDHLVGDGRRDLEIDVGYRPKPVKRLARLIRGWPATFYFTSVGAITAALIAAGLHYYRIHGGGPSWRLWVALLLLVPASEVALVFMQRLVAFLV